MAAGAATLAGSVLSSLFAQHPNAYTGAADANTLLGNSANATTNELSREEDVANGGVQLPDAGFHSPGGFSGGVLPFQIGNPAGANDLLGGRVGNVGTWGNAPASPPFTPPRVNTESSGGGNGSTPLPRVNTSGGSGSGTSGLPRDNTDPTGGGGTQTPKVSRPALGLNAGSSNDDALTALKALGANLLGGPGK